MAGELTIIDIGFTPELSTGKIEASFLEIGCDKARTLNVVHTIPNQQAVADSFTFPDNPSDGDVYAFEINIAVTTDVVGFAQFLFTYVWRSENGGSWVTQDLTMIKQDLYITTFQNVDGVLSYNLTD